MIVFPALLEASPVNHFSEPEPDMDGTRLRGSAVSSFA
jgi:hypothetical protein